MPYREFPSGPALKPFIECFWRFTCAEPRETQRVLPDGCADVIFNLGRSGTGIVVSGMMTRFADISFERGDTLWGVRFRPGRLSALTRVPLFEIKNRIVDARELIPQLRPALLERLHDKKQPGEQHAFLEAVLAIRLSKEAPTADPLVAPVITAIRQSGGRMAVSTLARSHGTGLRRLERRFRHRVGLTMKEFAAVIRFQQTRRAIAAQPGKSLLQIAFEMGYYDHAHLSNTFRHFSGEPPSALR